jgi:Kyakuja-Dileera-Zisupton transposase
LQKAPCENTFRAISNALIGSKACDITGVVAIACARHGCYAPNAIVDLFKNEQQKNVDFALLRAIETTGVDSDQGLLFMYDIVCQYIIHLRERIGDQLPLALKIDRAIGMFHVHGHKEQCFFRYAPSFIPGAGITCGEILESLWAALNGISPSTRTATLAHRAEILDDHACDSNHKKLLGMTKFLIRGHKESLENLEASEKYLDQLTRGADSLAIEHWLREIQTAEATRLDNPAVMDLYGSRGSHRNSIVVEPSAPSDHSESPTATELWLHMALMIEERQLVGFLSDTHLPDLLVQN